MFPALLTLPSRRQIRASPLLALWLLALFLILLPACQRDAESSDAPIVAASITPLGDLTSQLGEGIYQVRTLLPAGASPHGSEITPQQMRHLAQAEVLIVVGMGIDTWAERAAERHDVEVLRMADLLAEHLEHPEDAPGSPPAPGHEYAGHDHDHSHRPNPHLWLDPVLARHFTDRLAEKLEEHFPDHRQTLASNHRELHDSLSELHEQYRRELAEVNRRELVTFHNAFDLLAERYELKVIAHLTPIELTPGGEVTANRLREAIAAVDQHNLGVVYAEPQFPERALRTLQRRTGVQVLRLDPLGHPDRPGYQSYQQTMRSNLQTLVRGQNMNAQSSDQH